MRVFSEVPTLNNSREERTVAGFNLHVSIPIGANDRRGLERQLRYMGRPPLSEERLTKTARAMRIRIYFGVTSKVDQTNIGVFFC